MIYKCEERAVPLLCTNMYHFPALEYTQSRIESASFQHPNSYQHKRLWRAVLLLTASQSVGQGKSQRSAAH